MPHERIKNWWGWKKVTSLFTASLLWIWSVRAAERLTISDLIIFLHNALVLWCMIQDLLPISFFEIFFLLSLYYIDLKFDCPFNTIVIQTLNDEFKSQKTLQLVKEIVWEFFFLQTILIFVQPILFDSFDVRHENAENRPIFVPFVFRRDQHTMVSWCVDKIEQHSTILVRNDKKIFFMSMEIYTKESKGTR